MLVSLLHYITLHYITKMCALLCPISAKNQSHIPIPVLPDQTKPSQTPRERYIYPFIHSTQTQHTQHTAYNNPYVHSPFPNYTTSTDPLSLSLSSPSPPGTGTTRLVGRLPPSSTLTLSKTP